VIPLDPFDLGLEDVSRYPTCSACRKKSDGAVKVTTVGEYLCGTHYDEWLNSSEYRASVWAGHMNSLAEAFKGFVARLRRERYAACWVDPKE
jgi:hypothetical protein